MIDAALAEFQQNWKVQAFCILKYAEQPAEEVAGS
jgi:hypothetical protein